MAELKGNELVATTGGGDSGPEDIFAKLGPLLDMASEVRMNYKKGAASSVLISPSVICSGSHVASAWRSRNKGLRRWPQP